MKGLVAKALVSTVEMADASSCVAGRTSVAISVYPVTPPNGQGAQLPGADRQRCHRDARRQNTTRHGKACPVSRSALLGGAPPLPTQAPVASGYASNEEKIDNCEDAKEERGSYRSTWHEPAASLEDWVSFPKEVERSDSRGEEEA